MIFYIAILKGASPTGWWDVFTSRKGGHVTVFWEVSDKENFRFTQSLEYLLGGIKVALYLIPPEEWLKYLEDTGKALQVIEWKIDKIELFHYNLRGLMTCVSVVKAVIGLKAPVVFTPKQLAQELLRLGGKVVWVAKDQVKKKKPVWRGFKVFRPGSPQ